MNQCYQFKESLAKHFWKLFPKLARDKTDTGLDGPFQNSSAPHLFSFSFLGRVRWFMLAMQCSDKIIGDT